MKDWDKAYTHLLECIAMYTEIGATGRIALEITLLPIYRRYMGGERTDCLYKDIMSIK